jgi:hypothetical protein
MAMDLFSIIKHLTEPNGDPDLLDNNPEALRAYTPFMVNRAIAQSRSTVLYAQEMNQSIVVDKKMHYAFLFAAVKKSKRYSKWAKKAPATDKVLLIQQAYGVSLEKALELEPLIGDKEEAFLKQWLDTGGQATGRKPKQDGGVK